MGRSLDEAFVTSSYYDHRHHHNEYTGEPGRIAHHRTSSQPSRLVTAYRAVDNGQSKEPCGGIMDLTDGEAAGTAGWYCELVYV